jgi:hypothetical protein
MRSLVLVATALGASALALSASAQTPRQSTPDNPSSAASTPSTTDSASSQAQSATSSSASTSAASDKPVCKSVTTRGTLIPKRECHTQAEWDEMRTNAQQNLSNSNSNPGGPH